MALTEHALVNLATVKTELGIVGAGEDTTLTRLINAASDLIRNYCGRTFYFEEDIVETIPGMGGADLWLSRTPVVSIGSIAYDGSTLDSSEYSIKSLTAGQVYRAGGWIWTASHIASITGDPVSGTEAPKYVITYDGGYITEPQYDGDNSLTRNLPYDLEDACIQIVTGRYRGIGKNPNIESEKLMDYSVKFSNSNIPDSIKSVLDTYSRFIQA